MATREQGIRRTAVVTSGLAVASVMGAVAIGVAASASAPPESTPPVAPSDLPSGAVPQPQTSVTPGPDDGGDPDVVTIGS
jgi:hypothetical protein